MDAIDQLGGWAMASVLASLRIAPLFAFAPPFSLTRTPVQMRAILALSLAACVVTSRHIGLPPSSFNLGYFATAAMGELFLGAVFVLAFQLAFAGVYMAGRTLDIQAGFGLAALIDPTNNTQTPLIGTIYAYAAAAIFFAMGGHYDVLRIFAASIDAIPIGSGHAPATLSKLTHFISIVFLTSFGVAGGAILVLFLADLTIALLARTMPQMNVLVLGFQLKTVALLVALPTTFGVASAMLVRLINITLRSVPGLV